MKNLFWIAAPLLLAACQSPVAIVIGPGAEALEPTVRQHLATVAASTHLEFAVVAPDKVPQGTTDAIWLGTGEPTGPTETLAIHNQAPVSGASFPAVWTKAFSGPDGWSRVPLFWDTWGLTVFAPLTVPAPVASWDEATGGWPPGTTGMAAGGEAPLRAALVAALAPGHDSSAAEVRRWQSQPFWTRDTWDYSAADFRQRYTQGTKTVFVESFQEFFEANPPGFRQFAPLVAGKDRAGVVGRVMVLEARGTDRASVGSQAWAALLTSRAVQQAVSQRSGWMTANLEAPVLDPASATARKTLLQATRFARVVESPSR